MSYAAETAVLGHVLKDEGVTFVALQPGYDSTDLSTAMTLHLGKTPPLDPLHQCCQPAAGHLWFDQEQQWPFSRPGGQCSRRLIVVCDCQVMCGCFADVLRLHNDHHRMLCGVHTA